MEWKNSAWDKLPVNNQQVLISINGVYIKTRYSTQKSAFVDEIVGTHYSIIGREIYWKDNFGTLSTNEGKNNSTSISS